MGKTQSNQAPNLGDDSTFPSQSAPHSNPFTADLRGEFTSNFGTNTNAAVSQIFKDGGFGGENRTKYFLLGGLVLVLMVVGFIYIYPMLISPGAPEMVPPSKVAQKAIPVQQPVAIQQDVVMGDELAEDYQEPVSAAPVQQAAPIQQQAAPVAVSQSAGTLTLVSPANNTQVQYDESRGPMMFNWSGSGTVMFSRSPSMKPVLRRASAEGSFGFMHPLPGKWYWQVANHDGSVSEIRSFTVDAPLRRNIQLLSPAGGETLSGQEATVSWQGDSQVTYYRVELITADSNDWGNPAHRFQTSAQNSVIKNVMPGQYKIRLGAFSEVSGRFEYTQPKTVNFN